MVRLSKDLTNLAEHGGLIMVTPVTPEAIELLCLAVDDLTGDLHAQGIKNLVRNSQYWPNGAQLRAACLGVPVASLAAKGVDDDVIEVNQLWAWLVSWHSWLVDGNRYQLTIGPFSDHPVTHEFTNHSLNDRRGFPLFKVRPYIYEGDDAALQAARDDRRWCRLEVSMPPPVPPLLVEILEGLYGTVMAALQKFSKFLEGQGDHLQRNFERKGLELMAGRKENNPLPPSRQLSGAVQSDNHARHFSGIVTYTEDDTAGYYLVETLRKAQVDGLGIGDQEIEDHAVFLKNLKEIWNAPYPPIWTAQFPPPPGTVFRSHLTTQAEQDAKIDQEYAYHNLLEKRRATRASTSY